MSISDKLEKNEFILDGKNTSPLDEVIKLMTLNEEEIKIDMINRPELKKILGFEEIISTIEQDDSSDSDDSYIETFRMAKGICSRPPIPIPIPKNTIK